MPLRFIKYNLALLEDHLKEQGKGKKNQGKLPLLLNICLYHNQNEKPYPYSTNVYDLFENPLLAENLGIFTTFHLVDLNSIPDKELEEHKSIHLMEKLLKYSRHRDAFNIIKKELKEADIELLLESDYWKIVVIYASRVLGKLDEESKKEFVYLLKEKFNKTEEEIMETLAHSIAKDYAEKYLVPKLMQEYLQQGMQVRDLAIAKNMLFKLHLDFDSVQKATGLSKEILETLKEE